MTITMFRVGGCVRDELLGVPCKDIDFAVEAPSFEAMELAVARRVTRVFLINPEFLTIRALDPEFGPVDFVLCRKDGPSSDGRRPDFVEPGTIFDDLARRDFTVNAMARTPGGDLLDPHDGRMDLGVRMLRFVGDPVDRLTEDALRAFRALRFIVTKQFHLHVSAEDAIKNLTLADLNRVTAEGKLAVATNRIREELLPCFVVDGWRTIEWMRRLPVLQEVTEDRGIWLRPTVEAR